MCIPTITGRIGTGTPGPFIIPGVGLITGVTTAIIMATITAATITLITALIIAATITLITATATTVVTDMAGMVIAAATDMAGMAIAVVMDITAALRAMHIVLGIAATEGTDP